jgi:hypothetical protein
MHGAGFYGAVLSGKRAVYVRKAPPGLAQPTGCTLFIFDTSMKQLITLLAFAATVSLATAQTAAPATATAPAATATAPAPAAAAPAATADKKAPSAQQTRMKTCNVDAKAKALKGDERKAFMKSCLSADAAAGATPQQTKMKTCNADAGSKALKGDERKKFMSDCLKG